VRYGLPGEADAAAARRGELVLGGCVLTDDDPHRCCLECRAALWPGAVFAIPGAAGDLRIVLVSGRRRRLEASVGADGALTIGWRGTGIAETTVVVDADDTDLLSVILAGDLMNDGRRLMAWLERHGVGFVGAVDGYVDAATFTEDGFLSFSGPGGDLLVHGSLDRLLLQLVRHTFRYEGYRSIAEFHGWLSGIGLDIVHAS
jgi:hypothetical protein